MLGRRSDHPQRDPSRRAEIFRGHAAWSRYMTPPGRSRRAASATRPRGSSTCSRTSTRETTSKLPPLQSASSRQLADVNVKPVGSHGLGSGILRLLYRRARSSLTLRAARSSAPARQPTSSQCPCPAIGLELAPASSTVSRALDRRFGDAADSPRGSNPSSRAASVGESRQTGGGGQRLAAGAAEERKASADSGRTRL